MERYSEDFGYWKTLWWLVRRFASAPFALVADMSVDLKQLIEGLKIGLISLMLLLGPLIVPFTPLIAAWKVWDVKRKAAKRRNGEQP